MPNIPIQQPIPEAIAFNQPKKEVDLLPGLILAINQRLGGVAPSRDEMFFKKFNDASASGYAITKDPAAKLHGMVALKPTAEMQQGADLFVKEAMAATQSQDQQVLMDYIRKKLVNNNLLP
jgi:hypothetical protein